MIPILNKTNVDPADSEFPFGNIRDKTTLEDGTPVNVETYSDSHQFFMKMMSESGISPNNLLDNEYNGWQLWEALLYHCRNQRNYQRFYIKLSQASTGSPTVDNQAENDLGVSGTLSYVDVGDYRITFPGGTFPDNTKVYLWSSTPPGGASISLNITSDNIIRIRTVDALGTPANNILSLHDIYLRKYT